MNKSLQTYTPVAFPLDYDSLNTGTGCDDDDGNTYYGALPFTQVCVFDHDTANQFFAQLKTVAYSLGPTALGGSEKPFNTGWLAWVSTAGVRYAKLASITPPAAATGSASPIYAATTPTQLSLAFNADGYMVIAIQKTASTIEVKRIVDGINTITTTTPFIGLSPCLFYTGLLETGDPGVGNVVCYYLKQGPANAIFARFETDNFATEYTIMPDIRVDMARLISSRVEGKKHVMRGLDDIGRDITMKTADYSASLDSAATLDAAFVSGSAYLIAAESEGAYEESATLTIGFSRGSAFAVIAATETITKAKATLDIGFVNGECQPA